MLSLKGKYSIPRFIKVSKNLSEILLLLYLFFILYLFYPSSHQKDSLKIKIIIKIIKNNILK